MALAHALKIALQSKAKLDMMHVDSPQSADGTHWLDFPAVRSTLIRWGILPEGVRREDVAQTGVRIRKIFGSGGDPLAAMLRHFHRFTPDLIVLATHQREGIERWLHKAVAEPLARRSGAMTLFVPREGRGFVSLGDGTVELKKILIPIDHDPPADAALDKGLLLARGLNCVAGEFRLVHVGRDGTAPLLNPRHWPGWAHETVVRQGDVVEEILKAGEEWGADLMVLATQGHRDFLDALRGSTTERVVRGARCPVLAVPVGGAGRELARNAY
jgi:nucleotide-binding universal stress UspA family protein